MRLPAEDRQERGRVAVRQGHSVVRKPGQLWSLASRIIILPAWRSNQQPLSP
jgi:hypothetical protein